MTGEVAALGPLSLPCPEVSLRGHPWGLVPDPAPDPPPHPRGPAEGKAMFPRRSSWSRARAQSVPFRAALSSEPLSTSGFGLKGISQL